MMTATLSIYPRELKDEPLDYSPPILDLCVRKPGSESPEQNPEYAYNYSTKPYESSSMCPSSPKSVSGSETSTGSDLRDFNCNVKTKPTRPFKAYPKDPLSLSIAGIPTVDKFIGDSTEVYNEFRKKMLEQVRSQHTGTNKNMRRTSVSAHSAQNADPSYWEKRRKNNEAAKRSRDARRAKEDEIAIRCAFLEQENMQLKFKLAALEGELKRFQKLVYH